jgi:hypothetical protein
MHKNKRLNTGALEASTWRQREIASQLFALCALAYLLELVFSASELSEYSSWFKLKWQLSTQEKEAEQRK